MYSRATFPPSLSQLRFLVPVLKVTEDEIANAAGISDMHDGVNFMRAACVIAVEKVNPELVMSGHEQRLKKKELFMWGIYVFCVPRLVTFSTRHPPGRSRFSAHHVHGASPRTSRKG